MFKFNKVIVGDKAILKSNTADQPLHLSEQAVNSTQNISSPKCCQFTAHSLSISLTLMTHTHTHTHTQLNDNTDCNEVNVAACEDNWKISLFREYQEDSSTFLKVHQISNY